MELSDVLRRRRMVRAYDLDRPVPSAALDGVVEAALRAPSAGFTQGVSLLVLDSETDRDAFWASAADGGESGWLRGMRTAPVLILVWVSQEAYLDRYAEPDKGWSDRDPGRWSAPYWFVDAGMASMAALLAAVDLELGACFFGIPPDRIDAVRRRFGVPDSQLSVGVISLGYPDRGAAVSGSPLRRGRRPATDRVFLGTWG
jgi:nitroreductase